MRLLVFRCFRLRAVAPLFAAGLLTISVNEGSGPVAYRSRGPLAPLEIEAPEDLPIAVREVAFGFSRMLLPPECLPGDGAFDLVVFYHGAPSTLKRSFARSDLNAAVLVENVGIMSAPYADRFSNASTLDEEIERALRMIKKECPQQERQVRRVALAAWSAGFAAITRMLSYAEIEARVSAVLLSDGLHSALMDLRARTFPPNALSSVEAFARKAMRGEKLMVITHSEIVTPEYASTTECADYLLGRLGLTRRPDRGPGPVPGMERLTTASSGLFVLEGYRGGNESAHAQHLYAVGDLFFRRLKDFWAGAFGNAGMPANAGSAEVDVKVEIRGDVTCTESSSFVDCREDAVPSASVAASARPPAAKR